MGRSGSASSMGGRPLQTVDAGSLVEEAYKVSI